MSTRRSSRVLIGCLVACLLAIAAPGFANAESSGSKVVPALVGKRLDKSLKTLKKFDKKAKVTVADAVRHRRVGNKKNWVVVFADPEAGSVHVNGDPIHLGVRKKSDPKNAQAAPPTTVATQPAPPTTVTTQPAPPVTFPDDVVEPDAATSAAPVAQSAKAASTAPVCRSGDPMANVYHQDRLQLVNPCVTVSGTVAEDRSESDGDTHIGLRLDAPFAGLLNDRNRGLQEGNLVVELVPADKAGCTVGQPARPATGTYNFGTCTGAGIGIPAVGQHVAVTGPYVRDANHGWMEIHPAWSIAPTTQVADPAAGLGTLPAPPVVAPTTKPPTTTAPKPTPTTPPPAARATTTTAAPAPADPSAGATALCNDGSYSYAAHHQGACSHHGGVAVFYK